MIQIDMKIPNTCGDCPFCTYTADEKRYIGYCHTSDEDYYCKALDRFMEYDEVDGGIDILGKPDDCPIKEIPDNSLLCEELAGVVGKWSKNNPIKTNADILKELRDEYRQRAHKLFDRMDLKASRSWQCRADGIQDAIDLMEGKEIQ